ncbi:MAG: alpha/beta fold hydrolase [Caulobacteraceae bacterium]
MPDRPTLCLLPACSATTRSGPPRRGPRRPRRSPRPPTSSARIRWKRWRGRVLDMAAGPIWVAGHSMGGRVALEVWRLAPERVAGLALLDNRRPWPPPARAGRPPAADRPRLRRGHGGGGARVLPPMVLPDRVGDER